MSIDISGSINSKGGKNAQALRPSLRVTAGHHAAIDVPETRGFVEGLMHEAAHQRKHWGSEHDEGKEPSDWFWLLGWLAGKAVHAAITGDAEKALHRAVATAAVCANWRRALK